MINYEVAINSVRIVSKTLNIPEPHISFFNPSEITNKETTGMYLYESDEIILIKNGSLIHHGLKLL